MTGSKRQGILLGWNSANSAELEVWFPEPVEPRKPQQPGPVPRSRKAAENHMPGSHFNPGTPERWEASADYRVRFAPTIFIKQLLVYLWGAAKMKPEGCLSPPAFQTVF